jgi:hypothetical protein
MRAVILGLALLSTGCAWMFKGSKQDVKFTGIPEAADVRIDGQYAGQLPTHAELSRSNAQNIQVSKEGFKEQYVQVKRSPDTAWWFWDIATCVIPVTLCIPVLVDAISGSWMSLEDEVRVKLDPLPRPPASPPKQPPSPPPTTTIPPVPPEFD